MSKPTEKVIKEALLRLKFGRPKVVDKKRKLSILSLAEEAGVADSTIHNRYPEIATEVRELLDQEHKTQRDQKNELLKSEKAKNRELRKDNEELALENRKLVSINAKLEDENIQLKAELASGKVVRIG
jgi:hypothetical protein